MNSVSTTILPYADPSLPPFRIGTDNPARRGYNRRGTLRRTVSYLIDVALTGSIPPPNASTRTNMSSTTTKSVNLAAPVFVPKTSAGTFTPRINSPDPTSLALPPAGPRADAPEWPQLNTSQGLGASVCCLFVLPPTSIPSASFIVLLQCARVQLINR